MSNDLTLYGYDYAGYYVGVTLVVPEGEGYQPGRWTILVPPDVVEGEYAVYDGIGWRVTDKDRPDAGIPLEPEPAVTSDPSDGPVVL